MAAMIQIDPIQRVDNVFRIFLDSADHIHERSAPIGLNLQVVRVALHGPNDGIETTGVFHWFPKSHIAGSILQSSASFGLNDGKHHTIFEGHREGWMRLQVDGQWHGSPDKSFSLSQHKRRKLLQRMCNNIDVILPQIHAEYLLDWRKIQGFGWWSKNGVRQRPAPLSQQRFQRPKPCASC